jgi:hypothetical protein
MALWKLGNSVKKNIVHVPFICGVATPLLLHRYKRLDTPATTGNTLAADRPGTNFATRPPEPQRMFPTISIMNASPKTHVTTSHYYYRRLRRSYLIFAPLLLHPRTTTAVRGTS